MNAKRLGLLGRAPPAAEAGTPISPGELEVVVSVQVTYSIQ